MSRKLIMNPNFDPVPVHETDELFRNGIFEWNITCVIRMIEASERDFFKTAIDIRSVSLSPFLKDEHVEAADLSKPIIQAEILPEVYLTIDGNHRVAKARRKQVQRLEAYRLSADQHIPFFTTVRSYQVFIDYWNSKMERSIQR
ncbi:hypothetical protein, partial [Paenibacillus naphthalenovorans]|uniref:hypothetical protein n=1 Tax=Paenibacillus naphthalenovorans TaxID=162209 RepID=UPI001113E296